MSRNAVTFAVLIPFALSLGCLPPGDSPDRLREAKQEVLRLGGTVEENGVDGSILHISLEGCDVSSARWEKILPLKGLYWLQLNGTDTKDENLRHLQGCSRLETLELGFTDVTDKGLEALIGLPRLESLWLKGCRITDGAAKTFKKMDALEVVVLNDTYLTQQGFEQIEKSVEGMHKSLWSTVQSDEVREAMTALARGNCIVHSTSAWIRPEMSDGAREENPDRIRYEIYLTPKTDLDDDLLIDCLNTLANAGDLQLTNEGDRHVSLLPNIKSIFSLHIWLVEDGMPFDPSQLDIISQVVAERVQVRVPNLSTRSLTELTKVGGMRRLELHEQTITPEVWQALVQAPDLKTLALYDCRYEGLDQFAAASRPLNMEFSDVDSAPKSVRNRIIELATSK